MGVAVTDERFHEPLKKHHSSLRYRKPQAFFVRGNPRPVVLTRATSPPVYRPPLAVDERTGEIAWSLCNIEADLKDLGLL